MELTNVTRRQVIAAGAGALGAAAIAGLGAGSALAPRTALAATAVPETWDYETDVLIAGSGSGASGAIIDAFDSGSDVIVIEKMDWLGGTLRRSGGGIAAAGTCVQKALGVEDDVDDFYGYIVACGQGLVDEELLRTFVDRAAADFDWVVQDLAGQTEADWAFTNGTDGQEIAMVPGLDLSGTPVFFEDFGYTPVPRCYWFAENPDDLDPDNERQYCPAGLLGRPDTDAARGGTGLWKVFQDAIDERGVNVMTKIALTRLVANADGEVIGALCESVDTGEQISIKARKGVIVATGTWSHSDSLVQSALLGADTSAFDVWVLPEMGGGEGVVAALALGAGTISMAGGPWCGGLRTDTNAQVLDVFGEPIPRLYASSYAVGGKQVNSCYPHCGLHNMWNLTMGRVAAENVCALDSWE